MNHFRFEYRLVSVAVMKESSGASKPQGNRIHSARSGEWRIQGTCRLEEQYLLGLHDTIRCEMVNQ